MPKLTEISFEDLMQLCKFKDPKQFKRSLKQRGFQISPRKNIERKLADAIYEYYFRGEPLPWATLEQSGHYEKRGGVEYIVEESLADKIDEWYQLLKYNAATMQNYAQHLIGIVTEGGFLRNEHSEEFVINLSNSTNLLIGDRGSGKSTTLELTGLLADSLQRNSKSLVHNLMPAINTQDESWQNVRFRQIYKMLRNRDIEQYALYYQIEGSIYCYYFNTSERSQSILQHSNNQWIILNPEVVEENPPYPSILYLSQGEVTKITEDDNYSYINEILDALYPSLRERRQEVAVKIQDIINQYEYYKKQRDRVHFDIQNVKDFINDRRIELDGLWRECNQGVISSNSISMLEDYVMRIDYIDENFSIHQPIRDILKYNSQNAFYFLFIGRITHHLDNFIKHLKALKEAGRELRTGTPSESIIDSDLYYGGLIQNEELKAILSDRQDAQAFQSFRLPQDELSLVFDSKDDQEEDLRLKSKQAEVQQLRSKVEKLEIAIMSTALDFLEGRLRILEVWSEIYDVRRTKWSDDLAALARNYSSLLSVQSALIQEQQQHCLALTQSLTEPNFDVEIFTQFHKVTRSQNFDMIENLPRLGDYYRQIASFSPNVRFSELIKYVRVYDRVTEQMLRTIQLLRDSKNVVYRNFLYPPIEVSLKQGSVYRTFQKLSFGQKSGIILKIVSSYTSKSILIFDQPEDNLDTDSILNILIPTFKKASNKQLIVATHNSNLVMGLDQARVLVMESGGEYGYLRSSENLYSRNIIQYSLDILEGGVHTLKKKIALYQLFLQHARNTGVIRDLDIAFIESTFRQLSLDRIRNDIQPLLNDQSILNTARHELRNVLIDLQQDMKDVVNVSQNVIQSPILRDLPAKLDSVAESLRKHLYDLEERVNELRLLNIEPKQKKTNLYTVLSELKNYYLEKFSTSKNGIIGRQINIEIDETIADHPIKVDPEHIKLVFSNLMRNSLRATETIRTSYIRKRRFDFIEIIRFDLVELNGDKLHLFLKDNGCGMNEEITDLLYEQRVSDQAGKDHGLGGVIIRKLLDLNYGNIELISTSQLSDRHGTEQLIILPLDYQ